jgi:hypothetical protein
LNNLAAGTYSVAIFDNYSGCDSTYTFVLSFVNSIATIEEAIYKTNLYPNLANDYLTIEISDKDIPSVQTVEITDILGRNVYSTTIKDSKVGNKLVIAVNELLQGVYIVSVKHKNIKETHKLLISR